MYIKCTFCKWFRSKTYITCADLRWGDPSTELCLYGTGMSIWKWAVRLSVLIVPVLMCYSAKMAIECLKHAWPGVGILRVFLSILGLCIIFGGVGIVAFFILGQILYNFHNKFFLHKGKYF